MKLLRPVDPTWKISSAFGKRIIGGKEEFHKGIDFAVPVGTPVRACLKGNVIAAGYENPKDEKQGFGLRVWIQGKFEDRDVYFWMGHLSAIRIQPLAKWTERGQEIGLSGSTGRSTGPHLHVGMKDIKTGEYMDMEFVDV